MDRVGNRFACLRAAVPGGVARRLQSPSPHEAGGHRSLGGEHAAEYAAYAAAEPHEVEYRFARGEAMGELGKAAYREGLRRLEGLTNRGLPLGE